MFRRSMVGLSVEDVEKRRLPSKHYVYVIYVTWNDGSLNIIYRRYSRFFELQTKLLDKFPEEAGSKDPTRRIIPFLPGKILFGRSHIREVALKRLESINQYCKTLIKLPAHISECDEVLAFFETAPDDLLQHSKTIERKPSERKGKQISHPLLLDQYVATADYEKMGRNEVSLQTGMRVEVVEKTEVGWWFVSTDEGQGWVPSSHLEKEDGSQENRIVHEASPGEEERFVVVETYIPMAADEIRIDKGGFVQVIERNLDGWWLVRYQGNEGRVPATNLTQADTLKMNRVTSHVTAPPVEVIPNLMSISTFNRQKLDRLVSATSSKEGRGDRQRTTPESPTKPLIDLNFDTQPSSAEREQSRQGIDENFNPLLRNSRRKCPPPRRNSVSTVAPPRPAPPAVEAVYVAIADLSVTVDDGVSLQRGQVVSVLEKTETGWWYVSAGGDRGWAPVSYITKRHQAKKAQSASPRPPRPNPPPGKPVSGAGAAAATHDSSNAGLASLAAALQARCAQQQQSTVTVSDQTRQQGPQAAAAAAAVGTGTEQLYQNVEDSDAFTEIGRYVAAYPFEGVEVGEVRLSVGDLVDVLGRNVSGWWYVKVLEGCGQGEGWVPSNFLHQADDDAESTGSGVSGRLGTGVYAEVKNALYDDLESVWSDSSGSSAGPSPAHTAAVQSAARSEPVAASARADSNIEPDMKDWSVMSDNTTSSEKRDSDGFSDIERLSNFVRASFKGQRPALPLKQSKDAENSQQKMAMNESKPNIPFLKPVHNKSNEEEAEVKWKSANQPSCIPSVSSLRPTPSNKPVNNFKNSPKPAREEKPSLPVKKFSNGGAKPAIPMSKPGVGVKPSVPCNKPNTSSVTKPGVKPPVPGTKPPVKSTKPALPQNKPEDSRGKSQFGQNKNFSTSKYNAASLVKPGTKLAWPPGQRAQNSSSPPRQNDSAGYRKNSASPPLTSGSSSSAKPSKVQDLAKLFGQ